MVHFFPVIYIQNSIFMENFLSLFMTNIPKFIVSWIACAYTRVKEAETDICFPMNNVSHTHTSCKDESLDLNCGNDAYCTIGITLSNSTNRGNEWKTTKYSE